MQDLSQPTENELTNYLRQYVTASRVERIEEVLQNRTRQITVVMEDFENSHNGSAVLRSCEALGVQDVYFIENEYKNTISPHIAKGGGKWLTINRFNQSGSGNTKECLSRLKEGGYQIWTTTPSGSAFDITKLSVQNKVALVFGNEYNGVSGDAKKLADKTVFLPMYGFTESYNVSVSVALCLHVLLENLKDSEMNWWLKNQEKDQLRLEWYKKIVKRADLHEARLRHNVSRL